MTLLLNDKYTGSIVNEKNLNEIQKEVISAHNDLRNKKGKGWEYTGWLDHPVTYDREEYIRIKAAADRIKGMCDIFIVIGIGGSYLGARAAVEFVKSPLYNNLKKDTPDIYFAGNSISSSSLGDLIEICEGKDICINVVSKSGTTTEPAVAFRIFRDLLAEKYGEAESVKRIFVTTDKEKGTLKQFSDEQGYETFVVPDNIGGRYSVTTAVGLLPIAVAGIDIDSIMKGSYDAREAYMNPDISENDCYKYAALRNIMYRSGKVTEILASYEPSVQLFSEWWKQLYGESEGKDKKGIFPASVIFSTDLHSLGQYIQDGLRNIFETVIDIKSSDKKFVIGTDPHNIDGLNYLSGKTLHEVNQTAMLGTIFAHTDGNVPNIIIGLKDRSAYTFGYAVYFFELACAVSGYLLGVNPFDQPGVEAYKKNMFALLGKPGSEKEREKLEARIKS